MKHNLFDFFRTQKAKGTKSLAVLVDPDKISGIDLLLKFCGNSKPDLFLVGSSFQGEDSIRQCISRLREIKNVPIVLFPGSSQQVVSDADGLLLLSVISSRNAELIIGKHVEAAIRIQQSGLEIIPTGYLLIESGPLTSVQYVSQSLPIPRNKPEIAVATALAGMQLGLKAIYLEAGSGAEQTVPTNITLAVSKSTECILFTGGGITTTEKLADCYSAGCDIAVIGNILEATPSLLPDFIRTRDTFNS